MEAQQDSVEMAGAEAVGDRDQGDELCANARCRRVLPNVPGKRGRKFRCCPDRVWARRADGGDVSCAEIAAAQELLRDVYGDDAVSDARLAEINEGVQGVIGPVEVLVSALGAVRRELDGAVVEWQGRCAVAEAATADAEGRREAAERDRDAAVVRADAADARSDAAGKSERAAAVAARTAREAAKKAESARRREQLARASAQGALATERDRSGERRRELADVRRTLAIAQEEVRTLGAALEVARTALQGAEQARDEQRQRADAAIEESERRAREHEELLQRRAQEHREVLARFGDEVAAARVRGDELEQTLRAANQEHAGQLAAMREAAARLEEQLGSARSLAENAAATVARWRTGLADVVGQASPENGADPARAMALALLAGVEPGADEEGGDV